MTIINDNFTKENSFQDLTHSSNSSSEKNSFSSINFLASITIINFVVFAVLNKYNTWGYSSETKMLNSLKLASSEALIIGICHLFASWQRDYNMTIPFITFQGALMAASITSIVGKYVPSIDFK